MAHNVNKKLVPAMWLTKTRLMSIVSGQKTPLPYQKNLPKLPVPKPETTLRKFLDFSRAIQSKTDFEDTKRVVEEFVRNDLTKLQNLLEKRGKNLTNWLTPWWLNIAYLAARSPLPVVTSPGVLFPKFDFDSQQGQIEYAAKITQAALNFYLIAKKEQLKQDMAGKSPLDMSQYKFLFGTTRIPKFGVDQIKYGCDYNETLKHIVVIRNSHIFKVQVLDENESTLSIESITEQLKNILNQSEDPNPHPVGIVSSDNRDDWAKTYEKLKKNSQNSKNLEIIEKALFVVCLDRANPPLPGRSEKDEQARQTLHGSGSKVNSANRWFDKTIQFIIGTNGYTGMTYEHTPAEGPPVGALMDFVCDQFQTNQFKLTGKANVPEVIKLDFTTDETINQTIEKSSKKIDSIAADLDIFAYTFKDFGKNVPKSAKLSPDSFIQMAYQLAFFRIHSTLPPTYETATLRKFAEGRTENIRSPSLEAAVFVKKMLSSTSTQTQEVFDALVDACNAHKKYAVDCMNGNGMDRHLLAWKLISTENNLPTPQIFGSQAYQELNHFRLSTSQVPTKHFIQMCFGPSSLDCYGICYNPQEKELHFMISTFKSFEATSSKRFAVELQKALTDMQSVVNKVQKMHSKL